MKMSKESDEYFRRGAIYGFRAGYYSAIHEIQDAMGSAEAYDRNEKRAIREAYHMKDIQFVPQLAYRYSTRKIKEPK